MAKASPRSKTSKKDRPAPVTEDQGPPDVLATLEAERKQEADQRQADAAKKSAAKQLEERFQKAASAAQWWRRPAEPTEEEYAEWSRRFPELVEAGRALGYEERMNECVAVYSAEANILRYRYLAQILREAMTAEPNLPAIAALLRSAVNGGCEMSVATEDFCECIPYPAAPKTPAPAAKKAADTSAVHPAEPAHIADAPYLGLVVNDETRTVARGQLQAVEFRNKSAPWRMFKILMRAGSAGIPRPELAGELWGEEPKTENALHQIKLDLENLLWKLHLKVATEHLVWTLVATG